MNQFFSFFGFILGLSLLLTTLLFLLRKHFVKSDKIQEHIHPSIFAFFTSLYAFFLGFAIVTLWSAFLRAESNVAVEADSALIAFRLSKNLPNSGDFRQALADYVKSVINDEWKEMGNDAMSEETTRRLDIVWDKFHQLKPIDNSNNDFYGNLSGYLSEISKQRLSRTLLVKGNLYPPIWVIIIFGLISVLYGLYYTHIQQDIIRVIFDFMVVFLVLSCIYFIYDIDTPFSGYIKVSPDVIIRVHDKMLTLK